jgi:hypothetical protein
MSARDKVQGVRNTATQTAQAVRRVCEYRLTQELTRTAIFQ